MAWRRGQAYSQDLRDRILVAVGSAREVAARFGVSVSYVIKAKQRRDRFDETAARPQRSHTPRRLARWHEAIRAHVRAHPDATLDELRAWLLDAHGIRVSMGLMWNTLDRLRLTLKKNCCGRPNRGGRMLPRRAGASANGRSGSIPDAWYFSTKLGPRPT
jgi:transposase